MVSVPLCEIRRHAAISILTCVQFVPCIQGSVRIRASVVFLWTSNIVKTSNYRVTTLCRNQQRGGKNCGSVQKIVEIRRKENIKIKLPEKKDIKSRNIVFIY